MENRLILDETFLPVGATAPACDPGVVRVASFQERSYVAGPGVRAVVWVAGCLRRCPACSLPQFFSFRAGVEMPVAKLAARIVGIGGLDGVTYSGGEPFEQAEPLAELSRLLRGAGLTIASYSGYRREALEADPRRFGALLAELDILIDGEFRQDQAGAHLWRGSANQRVHVLRGGAKMEPAADHAVRLVQVAFDDDHALVTGFPSASFQEELAAELARRGILLRKPAS